jgi:hypothetical protein
MTIFDKIKNSKLIHQQAFDKLPIDNIHGANYLALCRLLFGTIELRARSGTFTTPYHAPIQNGYELFNLRYIEDKLSDLYDARAIEIFNYAKTNQKKIYICWSGGIDSTSILTSFLKNLSESDLEIIHVLCTGSSLLENYDFYKNFLSKKIKCSNYGSITLSNDFLDKNILLHGDPGDCVFGCSLSMYRDFISKQEHLEPWKKHYKKIIEELNHRGKMYSEKTSTFGSWIVKKISDNIEEVGQADYISTVADWWWWVYFNFRWQVETERMFLFMRIPNNFFGPISKFNLKIFREYNFFNSEKFQLWSYSNLKELVTHDVTKHKIQPKKYISAFTKNEIYTKNKTKIGIVNPNNRNKGVRQTPYFFDEDWQGYQKTPELYEIFRMLLEKYKG